jgi:hypothetical protein
MAREVIKLTPRPAIWPNHNTMWVQFERFRGYDDVWSQLYWLRFPASLVHAALSEIGFVEGADYPSHLLDHAMSLCPHSHLSHVADVVSALPGATFHAVPGRVHGPEVCTPREAPVEAPDGGQLILHAIAGRTPPWPMVLVWHRDWFRPPTAAEINGDKHP